MYKILVLLNLMLMAGPWACRTTNQMDMGGGAPSVLADTGQAQLSPEARCEFSGGELIEGQCYCADGTETFRFQGKADTCAQWMKQTYTTCYSKGGVAKRNDTGFDCFCPHGEVIDENGTQTCYEKFASKNRRCANAKGIILADDRVCRCMHGPLSAALEAQGTTCRADHQAKNQKCHTRGGLSRDGTTCECRDGTFIHEDTSASCPDPWFFHELSDLAAQPATPGAGTQPTKGGRPADSSTVCHCEVYKGRLVLHKPSPAGKALASKSLAELMAERGLSEAEINEDICAYFNNTIGLDVENAPDRGGCGGSSQFIPSPTTGSPDRVTYSNEVDPDDMCVCKPFFDNGSRCGVFKPRSNNYFISWPTRGGDGCSEGSCKQLAGGSEGLYRYCPKRNGKPLWRIELKK